MPELEITEVLGEVTKIFNASASIPEEVKVTALSRFSDVLQHLNAHYLVFRAETDMLKLRVKKLEANNRMEAAMTENEFGEVLRRIAITIAAVCAVCITVGVALYAMPSNVTAGTTLGMVVIAMISYGAWRMYKIVAWVTKVPAEKGEDE